MESGNLSGLDLYFTSPLKVRLIFDPPQSSSIIDAMNRTISELEWRLNVAVDPGDPIKSEG